MQLTTSTYSLHSILINLVTKVEQIVLCLSLYQQKCSLSIMYLLAWNIFVAQASLWALYVILAVCAVKLFSADIWGLPTDWQHSQPSLVLRPGQKRAWLSGCEQQSTLLPTMQVRVIERPLKILQMVCELYQEFGCTQEPVSVLSRLVQWEMLPRLHCLQSLPVIPLLHTNRPAWLHEEPEFENTAREALCFSLINSLLPKIEENWV